MPEHPRKHRIHDHGYEPVARDSGLANIAMIEFYRIMASPSDCNNPTLAAAIQTAAEKAASYIWDYGRSADGGLYYNSGYLSNGQTWSGIDAFHNKQSRYGDVTANITVSGTSVSTTATNAVFVRRFGSGSAQININGTNYPFVGCRQPAPDARDRGPKRQLRQWLLV